MSEVSYEEVTFYSYNKERAEEYLSTCDFARLVYCEKDGTWQILEPYEIECLFHIPCGEEEFYLSSYFVRCPEDSLVDYLEEEDSVHLVGYRVNSVDSSPYYKKPDVEKIQTTLKPEIGE